VLERGGDARALEALNVRRTDRADHVRVLAHRLLDTTPAVVADDVEQRRQALVHADRPHVLADGLGHLIDEIGVERRTPGDGGRVDGRVECGEAGEALLVRDRGDPEPVELDDAMLRRPQPRDAVGHLEGLRTEDAGEVAEAVGGSDVETATGERTRHRSDVAVAGVPARRPFPAGSS